MYPGPLELLGTSWPTWNLLFLLGVLAGYFVLRRTFFAAGPPPAPRAFAVRYLGCVYICALGAQWFAYLADSNTTIVAPSDVSIWTYYFNPLAGPKTLYGAILILPLAAPLMLAWTTGSNSRIALDRTVPALFTILAFARVGCFLQGCCYGRLSGWLGLRFPSGSVVHADQYIANLVPIDHSSLPVIPTQIFSALACAIIAKWSMTALAARDPRVFEKAVIAYSVWRLLIEFVRADAVRNHIWVLSTSQWVAIAILCAAMFFRPRPAELQR